MASPTHLIFVRHAEAAVQLPGRGILMSGWTDVPLTPVGVRQAFEVARGLAAEAPARVIYSSPLVRARSTAAPIAAELGLRIIEEPALREIGCGAADGLSIDEVRARFPGEWAANAEQLDPDFRWPGGESYREFRQRTLGAVERIAAANLAARVIIVTHTGVISQVLGFHAGASAACWERFRPRNATITELCWQEGHMDVIRFDQPAQGAAP